MGEPAGPDLGSAVCDAPAPGFSAGRIPSEHGGVSNYRSGGSFVPAQKGIWLIPP